MNNIRKSLYNTMIKTVENCYIIETLENCYIKTRQKNMEKKLKKKTRLFYVFFYSPTYGFKHPWVSAAVFLKSRLIT